jgi:hypothetical protein
MPPFDLKRREPHVRSVQLSKNNVKFNLNAYNNTTPKLNHNGYLCGSGQGGEL